MIMEWMDFLTVILIAFAVFMVLAGVFTAYFGTGKSRTVGFILLLVGIIVGAVWVYLTGFSDIAAFEDVNLKDVFLRALLDFVAILIGAIVAVALFLVAVMKS